MNGLAFAVLLHYIPDNFSNWQRLHRQTVRTLVSVYTVKPSSF